MSVGGSQRYYGSAATIYESLGDIEKTREMRQAAARHYVAAAEQSVVQGVRWEAVRYYDIAATIYESLDDREKAQETKQAAAKQLEIDAPATSTESMSSSLLSIINSNYIWMPTVVTLLLSFAIYRACFASISHSQRHAHRHNTEDSEESTDLSFDDTV